jgi:hypothetical protein
MKPVSKTAQKVLETLTAGLTVGESRTVDNTSGAYMAVHVDCVAQGFYSVAHYYTQNGDQVPDPMMVFWRSAMGTFHPVEIEQSLGRQVVVRFEGQTPVSWNQASYMQLVAFAGLWARNIRAQQRLR